MASSSRAAKRKAAPWVRLGFRTVKAEADTMHIKLLVLQWLVALMISPEMPATIRALQFQDPDRTALMNWRVQDHKVRPEDVRYVPVRLEQISPVLRQGVVLAEDAAFYKHSGYDLRAIQEAAWINIGHGKVVRGASTITQQLCKNLFLSNKRTLGRKVREILLAAYVEQVLSKKRILELYLNIIEWGPGAVSYTHLRAHET